MLHEQLYRSKPKLTVRRPIFVAHNDTVNTVSRLQLLSQHRYIRVCDDSCVERVLAFPGGHSRVSSEEEKKRSSQFQAVDDTEKEGMIPTYGRKTPLQRAVARESCSESSNEEALRWGDTLGCSPILILFVIILIQVRDLT